MQKIAKLIRQIFLGFILILLGMWVKDPIINLIYTQSNQILILRKWMDFSSVRIEPRVLNFIGGEDWVQKSFKLVNDSNRPIYRFRAYVSSTNSSIENVEIFFPNENQITAKEYDPQKHATCFIFHIKTHEGREGKLLNIYKIPQEEEIDFYIKAKGGTTINFDPVEWDPEESGIKLQDKGATEVPIFFTSNLGNNVGEIKISGEFKEMKIMFFKYQ